MLCEKQMLQSVVAVVVVAHIMLESQSKISWDLCLLGVLIHMSYFWMLRHFPCVTFGCSQTLPRLGELRDIHSRKT